MKIAVFISGSGTNLQSLLDAEREGFFQSEIALVVSNRRDAYGLVRAQEAGKATFVEEDGDLLEVLGENHIDFIVLAGYLKILGKDLLNRYDGRMINIH
ncbi:MAG: phosphoribosylglycinamide formyltransferase, partial [Aedoeadaptatus pacaensis]